MQHTRLLRNVYRHLLPPFNHICLAPSPHRLLHSNLSYATTQEKTTTTNRLVILVNAGYATTTANNTIIRPQRKNNNHHRRVSPIKPLKSDIDANQLWTQLENHYEQHGLLNYDKCVQLLQLLDTNGDTNAPNPNQLTGVQLHFLLGTCVPELLPAQSANERQQLFKRLWAHLRQREQLTLAHYDTYLQMLQQNQLPLPDYRDLLSEIAVFNGSADDNSALYSQLLDVACANGNMRQATELLADMRQLKFALTERNFHALLLGHARNGDPAGADSVLSSMRAAGINPNTSTQALCIVALVENGQLAKARDLLHSHMGSFNAAQVLQIMRSVVHVQHDQVHVAVVVELLGQLVRELPKDYLNAPDIPAAVRSLCIELLYSGRMGLMVQLVALLPPPSHFNENQKQNIDSYGAVLLQELFRARAPLEEILEFAQGLRQRGQNTRALHLVAELALRRQPATAALGTFEALAAAGEELRPHYFWPLILHHRRQDGESGVLRVLGDMQRLRVECDEDTLRSYVLPNMWQTLQTPVEGLKQLDACGVRVSQVLPHLLQQLFQQQLMEPALQLLQLYPTRVEVGALLQPVAAMAVHARATKRYQLFAQLVQALKQHSLQRNDDFVGALLLHMCSPLSRLRQDRAALRHFLHEMSRLEMRISPRAADTILATATGGAAGGDKEDLDEIKNALNKMRDAKLQPPTEVATSSSSGSGSSSTTSNASFIKHPRDMKLEELECHLIELEAKQLNTRGVLRRLLQLCVRDGRLERALEVKAKCEKLRVQKSAGMMAAIFDLHIKLKDLRSASQALEEMQRLYPGFLIDEHKLIDYAALLIEGKQLDAAKQLLQERAAKHKVNGGDYVIKNVWQLLTNVAKLSAAAATEQQEPQPQPKSNSSATERNATYQMFQYLRQLGFCQAHNALLGPVIREWLLRGDIDSAVAEFQQLAVQHKHTPLQFELLSLLVRLSNSDANEQQHYPQCTPALAQQHLATVTATVSRVHGNVNMNSAMLLALAESGTETQLRRLVINPEFRLNHDLLLKNCEHLGQEGSVRTLLKLARGVRGLQRTIDEQRIYDLLLSQFAKTNNCEAALDLYERLEADDELKVSQEFLRKLVKMLQLNNLDIPSNIALRAQIL